MAIGPMQFNAIMTRTQDYTQIKQNENMKPIVDQSVFQNTIQKNVERKLTQVEHPEDTDTYQRKQDAKEKGKNEYHGDGGRNRKRGDTGSVDGRVIRKDIKSFDFSV